MRVMDVKKLWIRKRYSIIYIIILQLCKIYASGKGGMELFSYEERRIPLFLASSILLSGIEISEFRRLLSPSCGGWH